MSATLRVAPADTDAAIAACLPALRQLRPHLPDDPAGLVARVRRQAAGGYRLLALWDGARAVAVAGWRLQENLIRGRFLYVDDLVTLEAERGRGHGDRLMDALADIARAESCRALLLDSGVTNGAAHRFYFRRRMTVTALHFALPLE